MNRMVYAGLTCLVLGHASVPGFLYAMEGSESGWKWCAAGVVGAAAYAVGSKVISTWNPFGNTSAGQQTPEVSLQDMVRELQALRSQLAPQIKKNEYARHLHTMSIIMEHMMPRPGASEPDKWFNHNQYTTPGDESQPKLEDAKNSIAKALAELYPAAQQDDRFRPVYNIGAATYGMVHHYIPEVTRLSLREVAQVRNHMKVLEERISVLEGRTGGAQPFIAVRIDKGKDIAEVLYEPVVQPEEPTVAISSGSPDVNTSLTDFTLLSDSGSIA